MKNHLISPGIYIQVFFFFIGIWLVIAPFAMQTQPAGGSWQDWTINEVAAGGLLIALSLLGTLVPIALALRSAIKGMEERSQQNG